MKNRFRNFLSLAINFAAISLLLLLLKSWLIQMQLNPLLLFFANLFFFFIFLVSAFIHLSTIHHKNPHVFVRGVMGSMLLKMMTTAVAVFIYTSISGAHFDKKSIFIAICLYLPYLFAEMMAIRQKTRKPHAQD